MRYLLNTVAITLIVTSMSGCCERRCGVHGPVVQEPPQPIIQHKLEKMKIERGGK